MNSVDILEIVIKSAEELTNVSPLSEKTDIYSELSIDSVKLFELVGMIEDELDITIPDRLLSNVQTLGDIAQVADGIIRDHGF